MKPAAVERIAGILALGAEARTGVLLPFIQERGEPIDALGLNCTATPQEVLAGTARFIATLIATMNIGAMRELLHGLHMELVVLPDPSIGAYVMAKEGVVVLHAGFGTFVREFASTWCWLQRIAGLQRRMVEERGPTLPAILSGTALEELSIALMARLFAYALGHDRLPAMAWPSDGDLSKSIDVVFAGVMSFVILHEYGHLVGKMDWPFDEGFSFPPDPDFQVVPERIDRHRFAEYLADRIALETAPEFCRPWLVSSAALFLSVHSVLEDLCYDNRRAHPRAANRLSLLLKAAGLDESGMDRLSSLLELGSAVLERRTALERLDEPLPSRRERVRRFVAMSNQDELAARLSAVASSLARDFVGTTRASGSAPGGGGTA